jgi:hypothetical protein
VERPTHIPDGHRHPLQQSGVTLPVSGPNHDVQWRGLTQLGVIAAQHLPVVGIIQIETEDNTIGRIDDGAGPILHQRTPAILTGTGADHDPMSHGFEQMALLSTPCR